MEDKNDKQESIKDVNLSQEKTNEIFDNYARFGGDVENVKEVLRKKSKYNKDLLDKEKNQAIEAANYALGLRTGLPQRSFKEIEEQRRAEIQKLGKDALKDAKSYYKESLQKEFNKSKDEDMERDR